VSKKQVVTPFEHARASTFLRTLLVVIEIFTMNRTLYILMKRQTQMSRN